MGFDEFIAWLKLSIPDTAYTYARGQWTENTTNQNQKIIAVHNMGGPAPDVEDRRPRYRVIMLGRRNQPSDMGVVYNDIMALSNVAMGNVSPCGAANIRATMEPIGPGTTIESRKFFTLDFEVLF